MDNVYVMKEFLLANGMSQLPNSSMTDDLSPYDYFDGGLNVEVDPDFSDASGKKRKKKKKGGGFEKVMSYTPLGMAKKGIDTATSSEARKRRDQRRKERLSRRDQRRADKNAQAEAQNKAVQDVQKQAEADAQLLAQLNQPIPPVLPTPSQKMSKNTKIALTIGGLAVAIFLGFVVYKKFKK